MKKLIAFSLLTLTYLTIYANYNYETLVVEGESAHQLVYGATKIRTKSYTNIPNYIKFAQGQEFDLKHINNWVKKMTLDPASFSMTYLSSESDRLGFTHYRYRQSYKGYPIEHAAYIAHTKNGKIISMNGEFVDHINAPINIALTEKEALRSALKHVGASKYMWEVPNADWEVINVTGDQKATYDPKGELMFVFPDADFTNESRLTYRFDIYAVEPIGRYEIYVDAENGEIVFENSKIHTGDTPGTATTAYSGVQNIVADSYNGSYRLREVGRGNGIETYDLNGTANYGGAVDFTDADNNWTTPFSPTEDQYAMDAHWGSEMTYDYLDQIHGRNSIDNAGFKIMSYVHHNVGINAFWDGTKMTYGDGDGGSTFNPLTSIDVAGHEIAHGLVTFTADLVYQDEPGALNESFADIVGTSVDFFARPSQANWLLGEEVSVTGDPIRNLMDPNAKNDPKCYLGTYWHSGPGDHGGVHTNSGVQNFWYYLLVNGGTGTNDAGDTYNVIGLGMAKAEQIALRNLTVYLTSNSQYADARFYSIQAAEDLYGACSSEMESTGNAWYAVCVGGIYSASVTAYFQVDVDSSCAAPLDVTFTNLTNNGNAFIWDFGDGSATTTVQNPGTHTYANYGTFTVELIADGGICGADTFQHNIVIDSNLACNVILPANDTFQTQIKCLGNLFDDGGPNGIYSPSQNSYVVISPTGATSVTLDFLSFDVELGSGTNPANPCDYDYVEVYDGSTTAAPLIGRFCNSNPPPAGGVTSTGGPIMVYFHTDPSLNQNGFEIAWSCSTTPVGPATADFTGEPINICEGGLVNFNNLSTNSGSFNWTFPGGIPAASTAYNPTVQYPAAGTYDVTLVATNAGGTDTEVKTAYITVDPNTICDINIEPNDEMPTMTGCKGILYDDGGAANDYSEYYDTYVTIAPTSAAQVEFWFNAIDIEAGSGGNPANPCDYDYIEVFDGNDPVFSPLIGKWCNSDLPTIAQVFQSTGPVIMVHFHSDDFTVAPGFELEWECISTATALPVADFTYSETGICQGQTVQFFDNSLNVTTWNWSFPGGTPATSSAQNPIVTYSTPGTYGVTLTANNANGSDPLFQQNIITVSSGPLAFFNYTQPGSTTVSFTDQSINSTNVTWDFGDSTSSTVKNPVHTYSTPGTYQVCLYVGDSNSTCPQHVLCDSITVTTGGALPPVAQMGFSDTLICVGDSVSFFDQSANNPTSWNWTFPGGNPATSTQQNPVVYYPTAGLYDFTLIASNASGTDTISFIDTISVVSGISANYAYANTGLTYNFTDQSTGGTQWYWDFGDASSSTMQNPSHTYAQGGIYYVCLTVSNGSCPNELYCDSIIVANPGGALPSADYTMSSSTICEGESITFTDITTNNPFSWLWSFPGGSPASSNVQNPVVTYNTAGSFNVTLTATNLNGNDFKSVNNQVTVLAAPKPDWNYFSNGQDVQFYDFSTDVDSILWVFGDGNSSTDPNPLHTYQNPGTYFVCLTGFNSNCQFVTNCDSMLIAPGMINGLSSLEDDEVTKVYPNPTDGLLNIEYSNSSLNQLNLRMFDPLGKAIIQKEFNKRSEVILHQIDLSQYASGIYILMLNEKVYRIINR
jgi:PKD repeat protein